MISSLPTRISPLVVGFAGFCAAASALAPANSAAAEQNPAADDREATAAIQHVAVDPTTGAVQGRILGGFATSSSTGNPPARVRVRRQGLTLAVAAAAPDGSFVLPHLPPGLYAVDLAGSAKKIAVAARFWSHPAAPPCAKKELLIDPHRASLQASVAKAAFPPTTTRGQSPEPLALPIMSLRQAATLGGIAAGAIATPMIYHNTLIDNKLPASH